MEHIGVENPFMNSSYIFPERLILGRLRTTSEDSGNEKVLEALEPFYLSLIKLAVAKILRLELMIRERAC